LAWDASGRLWIGTAAGLARMSADATHFERFRLDTPAAPDARHNAVGALRVDAKGTLWIGTGAGVEAWTPGAGAPVRRRFGVAEGLPEVEVQALLADADDGLWVGTRNTGLLRWDAADGRFLNYRQHVADPHSLADDNVMSLYQDRGGTLWVGTRTGGASRADLGSGGFERYAVFDPEAVTRAASKIYAIAGDADGTLWLGSVGGGLHHFDRRSGQTRTYRHDPADPASLPDDTVMSVHIDAAGRYWIGTYAGLARFDPAIGRFATQWRAEGDPALERVRRIESDANGVLWLGTEAGLVRHDPADGSSQVFRNDPADPRSVGPGWIVALHVDRSGQLWVGTDETLDQLLPDGQGFSHRRNDPRISYITEDRRGRLWIGTADGLIRLDDPAAANSRVVRYDKTSGLTTSVIGAALEDAAGRMWISTTAGISRLDPDTGAVRNFTNRDGLIDGSYYVGSAWAMADGTLLFGGQSGLNGFQPGAIRDNAVAPTVAITDVQLSQRALDPKAMPAGVELAWPIAKARTLRLANAHPVFTLEFAALHFADPQRNRYRYRLVGFDPAWIEADATRRFATYTNLDPGEYVFEVTGSNKDGVWSDAPATLAITVLPPWWATWWARSLAVALFALALWAAYRLRVRGLTQQRARLQHEVATAVAEITRQKETIEQAHQDLTVLGEIGREITASLDQHAVLHALDRHVHDLLDATTFGIYLLDDDGRGLTSVWRKEGGDALPVRQVGADDRIANVAICARERRELQVDIAPGEEHPTHIPGTMRSLSMLFAPLAIGERLLGVMTIQSPAPAAYGERERVIFRSLSAYGAIGLDNAAGYRRLAEADAEVQRVLAAEASRFEGQVRERTTEVVRQKADIEQAHATLSVLGEIGREITATLDESEVCQTLDRHVHGLLDSVTFAIYRLDADGRALTSILRMEHGLALPVATIDIDNATRIAARCAREREEFLIELDPDVVDPSNVPGTVVSRSMLFAPLVVGERLLGVMTIQSPREHAYGQRERLVFRTLSAYGAIALDNAAAYRRLTEADAEVERVLRERQQWLEQEVQARTSEVVRQKEDIEQAHAMLSALGEIGREITATLDEAALFSTLERRVRDLLDATSIAIYRLDDAGMALDSVMLMEAGAHLPPERLALDNPSRKAALCARERRELLIDVAPDEVNPSHIPGTLHTLSALFAPLVIGDRLLGVMTIQSPRRHAYGERERLVFRTLCAYGAIALHNAATYLQLRETDESLQRNLREREVILDNVAAAVFQIRGRRIERCNRGMEEMLGYAAGELLGQSTEIYHQDHASWEAQGRQVYTTIAAGQVAEGEWEIVRKDGSRIWVAFRGRAIDPTDPTGGSIWVAQDITERKRTGAELERIRREQQLIFDNMSGGVWIARGSTVHRCNRGFEQMLGLPPGAGVGRHIGMGFLSRESYSDFVRRTAPEILAGRVASGESEFESSDGSRHWMLYQGKALDVNDIDQGTIWFGHDITERKLNETALREANERLARGLAEV
ncbi:MAG: two-component regulator propeller domain-containing protein, partial [Arenimonas sp.]